MSLSLIICTKNRAAQLEECLKYIAQASVPPCDVEIIIVDNGSTDATLDAIGAFAAAAPFKVSTVHCERPGLGRARNYGLRASSGEWRLFTDDDCYVEQGYFQNFFDFVSAASASTGPAKDIRYGCGSIVLYDEKHDPRIANLDVPVLKLIPVKTLMAAGTVQGANMFYHCSVFDKTGPFNDNMGAGTPFACEDIDMATRASLDGFVGALVPFFKVTHHHRRLRGSVEANATVESYDYGRGAYYASLIERGVSDVWKLWEMNSEIQHFNHPRFRDRLVRELEGAASYLKAMETLREQPAERERKSFVG
jgi:glycosyltransferase involved in cell wall biosynthesis